MEASDDQVELAAFPGDIESECVTSKRRSSSDIGPLPTALGSYEYEFRAAPGCSLQINTQQSKVRACALTVSCKLHSLSTS